MSALVYLNGRLVAESEATVSVFDRGFLYGDGLFETLRIAHGRPFRWDAHWERFDAGLRVLRLKCPETSDSLRTAAVALAAANHRDDAVLRLAISRGCGPRGYSPRGAGPPTLVMSVSPHPGGSRTEPLQWRVATSGIPLPPATPISGFKGASKLLQVVARAEAEEAGADEALMLDARGDALEGTSGNLFWFRDGTLNTPPIRAGVLPGIGRRVIQELAGQVAIPWREGTCSPSDLRTSDGAFLSISTQGLVEIVSLDGHPLPRSPGAIRLWRAYEALVDRETRSP
jgi:branched-chain amino acid aminotransferase